jgi:hypothetical protein
MSSEIYCRWTGEIAKIAILLRTYWVAVHLQADTVLAGHVSDMNRAAVVCNPVGTGGLQL